MLDHAIQAARLSEYKYKVGAACYDRKGRLISVGTNTTKTHPLQHRLAAKVGTPLRIHLHAELMALIRSKGRAYRLVVVRITKMGLAFSKPCPICQMAIAETGVKEIMYIERDGKPTLTTL